MSYVEYKNSIRALSRIEYLGSVASQSAMLALLDSEGNVPQLGDWCFRSDLSEYYIVTGNDATQIGSWTSQGGSAGSVAWTAITGKPSTFTPSTHSHPISEVTNLQTTLDGKQDDLPSGTVNDYLRGDLTMQTLNKSAVGLGNVDNTSDTTKNSASASLTNKTIDGSLNTLSNIPQSAVTNLTSDLGNKQATITGAATTIDTEDLTANRAVISNSSGKIAVSSVTDTELGYVSGATSNIQSQLGNKQPLDTTLTALAAHNTNGLLTQTAPDTFTGRSVVADGSNTITVTNGDGVSGNITLAVNEANVNINNLAGTNALKTTQSTGVYTGGVLSIGTPNTKFSISDGAGYVVDVTVNPPTVTQVTWSGLTNLTPTYLTSHLVSYIAIDSAGAVVQSSTPFTNTQSRDYIVLGSLIHVNLTNLDAINNFVETRLSPANRLNDLAKGIGMFNVSGNVFSSNGANLKLNKSAGVAYRVGSNYVNNVEDPDTISLAGLTALTFQYRFQNGTNGTTGTDINPDIYDNAGTSTAVPTNKFTIQRIYSFVSNNVKIQPGQTIYNSLAEAKAAITTETFITETSIANNGMLRGYLIVKQGTTSLASATNAFFLEATKFGGSAGVGGTTTLQGAYDNSTTPEILTNTTNGALTVKRGSAADTDNVIEVKKNDDTTTFAVTGNGVITGATISGSTNTITNVTATTPIGAIRADIGATTVKTFYDTLFTETKGKWLRTTGVTQTAPISIISANYPDIAKDTDCNNMRDRTWLWLASGNYGFARLQSTNIQTTSDFSTYTNREVEIDTIYCNNIPSYTIDYDGTKVVRLSMPTSTAGGSFIGYSYSENGTTFTSVYGRVVSGVYTVLSNPCISGSTYSFWSSLDNARIYTTDHTNWTVCTNSINAPVHKMNNGTLYCLTASSTDFKYSTDNGQTWTTGTLPSAATANTFEHCIDYDGTNYVFVKGTTTVYYGATLAFGSTASFTALKNQVWFRNAAFIATNTASSSVVETCTNPSTWTQRTLSNAAAINYVLYAHSKYFVIGTDRVMSSSDLSTWTSEIASGITAISATALPQTFACASGNNLVFISSGTINIYQSGSWTAVTNSQQNTGLATLSLGVANVFTKVRN